MCVLKEKQLFKTFLIIKIVCVLSPYQAIFASKTPNE